MGKGKGKGTGKGTGKEGGNGALVQSGRVAEKMRGVSREAPLIIVRWKHGVSRFHDFILVSTFPAAARAAAATTTATAATATTARLFTRFAHFQGSAHEVLAIKFLNRQLDIRVDRHLDKPETA